MNDLKFSILIPTYNGGEILSETLRSIFSQDFSDYEIIINDDCSTDNTEEIVRSFNDPRVKFFRNIKNLGYPGNLEEARKKATGEIVYLMGQDDILAKGAMRETYEVFKNNPEVGAVTRPYFWFDKNIKTPVRAKEQLNPQKNEIVRITDNPQKIISVFKTLDQLSGLAYRKSFMDLPFHPDIFPCHIYPFASIFKRHPIVYLKDYNLAVRIASSQCRSVSSIYNKSPMQSWVEMFESVFKEKEFRKMREYCIKNFVAVNYVGLVQLRNYAKYRYLLREIFYLIKYRWQNIFSFQFWFFSLGCIIMPAKFLIPMVDWYKNKVNAKNFKHIKFEYQP
ncbi:MAG: glycosyltransferase family 2 protein [Parcubacteria group bacterium]|jgi:glycosyltransferase involved in cell wall biosynthesis